MSEDKVRKTAAYLRVSTARQRDEETIKTQERIIDEFCIRKNTVIDEWYPDDGVSGIKAWNLRPQGKTLFEKIKRGQIDTLICSKLDRLGRSARNNLDIIEACIESKTKLILVGEGFDIESKSGKMMISMLTGFAEYERDLITERSAEGKRTKIASGKFLGRPPYGYKLDENKKLILDSEKAKIVAKLFDLYLRKGSLKKVAQELTAMGVPTPTNSNRGWMTSTIANILNHEVYCGSFRNYKSDEQKNFKKIGKRNEGDIIIHEVEPVVSRNIWLRVQDQLTENKAAATSAKRAYLLSGIIKCGRCGNSFIGHTLKQNRRRPNGEMVFYPDLAYYICTLKNANGSCQNGRVRSDDLEEMIWEDIEEYLREPGKLIEGLLARQREQFKESTVSLKDLAKIEKKIAALELQRTNLIRAFTQPNPIFTADECSANLAEIRRHLEEAATIKANFESELSQNGEREARKLATAQEILEKLSKKLDNIDVETKHDLIRLLTESITVYAEVIDKKREALVQVVYRFQTTKEIVNKHTDSSIQSLKGGGRCWQHTGQPAMLPKDKLVAVR